MEQLESRGAIDLLLRTTQAKAALRLTAAFLVVPGYTFGEAFLDAGDSPFETKPLRIRERDALRAKFKTAYTEIIAFVNQDQGDLIGPRCLSVTTHKRPSPTGTLIRRYFSDLPTTQPTSQAEDGRTRNTVLDNVKQARSKPSRCSAGFLGPK